MFKCIMSIVLMCGLFACEGARKEMFPTLDEESKQIIYVKDKRTNLCFVRNTVYTNINSKIYTYVPCTTEVEMRLSN